MLHDARMVGMTGRPKHLAMVVKVCCGPTVNADNFQRDSVLAMQRKLAVSPFKLKINSSLLRISGQFRRSCDKLHDYSSPNKELCKG
jgi:hypothetical protein